MNKLHALCGLALVVCSTFATIAAAAPVSVDVDAIDAIYNADGSGPYSPGSPVLVTLPGGALSFTFTLAGTTRLSFNGGGNINDADGVGAAVGSSSNTGTAALSGIVAPNAGYLVGVFLGATLGGKPTGLTYTDTTFASSSPLLQQVFFIGDGLTGDGVGTTQTFFVPTGATSLYLGFSDAGGYNGAPGAYDDNTGFLSGDINIVTGEVVTPPPSNGVPEPTALALLGAGALAAAMRRRRR